MIVAFVLVVFGLMMLLTALVFIVNKLADRVVALENKVAELISRELARHTTGIEPGWKLPFNVVDTTDERAVLDKIRQVNGVQSRPTQPWDVQKGQW